MSTSPSPSPPAPHPRRRLQRPHLRLVHAAPEPQAREKAAHGHALHRASRHVTAVDAIAILATLYLAVVLIRFLAW